MKSLYLLTILVLAVVLNSGCSRNFWGGAAIGAGGAGAAYEYQNKKALEELEDDFQAGQIDKDEFLRRKKEIQDRSLVY